MLGVFIMNEKKIPFTYYEFKKESGIDIHDDAAAMQRVKDEAEKAKKELEDKILVVGLGSIGLIMAQAIQAMGYRVFACDLLEDSGFSKENALGAIKKLF